MDYYQCKRCNVEFLDDVTSCTSCESTREEIRCPACGSKEVAKTGQRYGEDRAKDWEYKPVRFG